MSGSQNTGLSYMYERSLQSIDYNVHSRPHFPMTTIGSGHEYNSSNIDPAREKLQVLVDEVLFTSRHPTQSQVNEHNRMLRRFPKFNTRTRQEQDYTAPDVFVVFKGYRGLFYPVFHQYITSQYRRKWQVHKTTFNDSKYQGDE